MSDSKTSPPLTTTSKQVEEAPSVNMPPPPLSAQEVKVSPRHQEPSRQGQGGEAASDKKCSDRKHFGESKKHRSSRSPSGSKNQVSKDHHHRSKKRVSRSPHNKRSHHRNDSQESHHRSSSRRHHNHHRRRSDSRDDRRKGGKSSHQRDRKDRHHKRRSSSSNSSSRSKSSSSSSSSRSRDKNRSKNNNMKRHERSRSRDHHRRDNRKGAYGGNGKPQKAATDVHPYFQKAGTAGGQNKGGRPGEPGDPNQALRFWDGFQWVYRTMEQQKEAQKKVTDINIDAVATATQAVTGEDAFQKEKRLAASKTVIIENIALDLGLTAREIQKFLLSQLETVIGESGVEIADIDMNNGPNSIAVELADKSMVDKLKKLDGRVQCLGETWHIRKLNEETVQTSIQSAAITLVALQNLTGASDGSLNLKSASLKTVAPSCVIKVSNVFEREEQLTPELFEELKEDMEDEFLKIPHLKRIKIVRNGEERLGAEVGCVFVEFRDKKSAELALKKIKGRIYDGREIQATYIDEKLYYKELCME